ncbi:hypothetical protein SISSUDRAFT_1038318 [Sistotremastrum suecicum HHB10207 ss-3]|uniref:Uncharacterized protein n=1 Tax=Sistotremastrum suecicum HHB10207 ss-3 TaxID=1314776 RepID=A0A165WXD1_9AGAM|nr:hypothetical protein SISSUDRAFT_1038318 [Sistotremastrum suecicum HHB10207 ss-3]
MALTPAYPNRQVFKIIRENQAVHFIDAFKRFLRTYLQPSSLSVHLDEHTVFDLYSQINLQHINPTSVGRADFRQSDVIRVHPAVFERDGRTLKEHGVFDTVRLLDPKTNRPGFLGTRVARVKALFTLPSQFGKYNEPLAYVEMFTEFRTRSATSKLYKISHSMDVIWYLPLGLVLIDNWTQPQCWRSAQTFTSIPT